VLSFDRVLCTREDRQLDHHVTCAVFRPSALHEGGLNIILWSFVCSHHPNQPAFPCSQQYSPPKLPELSDLDEEEADAIEEAFDHDYDVAQQFRSHIIPKAVLWFTGEAMQHELEGIFEGDDTLLSPQMAAMVQAGAAAGNPFPPPVNGSEEPECKQS